MVGFAVAQSAREPSASLGATAAVIAVAALIVAKVLILELALPSIMRGEVLKDRGATAAMFLLDMGINRSFSPELQRQIEQTPENAPLERQEELQQRMISEARARAGNATPAGKSRSRARPRPCGPLPRGRAAHAPGGCAGLPRAARPALRAACRAVSSFARP